jgi:hypothetical protein
MVELADMINVLLPSSHTEAVQKIAEKIIRDAVALKDELTNERVLYWFYWVEGGNSWNMPINAPDGQHGPVLLCTFPGLARVTKGKDKTEPQNWAVVKASVELQSVCPKHK